MFKQTALGPHKSPKAGKFKCVTSPRTFILDTREEEKELDAAGGDIASRTACWFLGTNLHSSAQVTQHNNTKGWGVG